MNIMQYFVEFFVFFCNDIKRATVYDQYGIRRTIMKISLVMHDCIVYLDISSGVHTTTNDLTKRIIPFKCKPLRNFSEIM